MAAAWMEIAPGFWNLRGRFKIGHLIDLGTHMSCIRLSNGRFLVVDAVSMDASQKAQFDAVTHGGALIEAVIMTHPFHTLSVAMFHVMYPHAPYFGCPRHLRNCPYVPWAGRLDDHAVLSRWLPDVVLAIPDGAEFAHPVPESTNHFVCVWVYAARSGVIHVDDSICGYHKPSLLLKAAGMAPGKFAFHRSLKSGDALARGPGGNPAPGAAAALSAWFSRVPALWQFHTAALAHGGVFRGDAKLRLLALLHSPEAAAMWSSLMLTYG